MKISVAVLGSKVSVEVENGANASEALAVFERISGKVVKGMDVYSNGQKIEDLDATKLEDGAELVAVKSKHESASGVTITVKVLGNEFKVECEDGTGCSEALETFERVTGKAMKGMDLYVNGQKSKGDEVLQNGDEVVAIKSKHESAAKISLKVLGSEFKVECEDGTNCSEALETFERVTGKALAGMDLYVNGQKSKGEEVLQTGDEVVAIKSKHESAS